MKNKKKDREPIRFCGGKKCGSTWAGATVLITKIKVSA